VRIVLSIDMEGVSQLREPREILAACPEYWQTGRARFEADTVAAAEGLLAAGADDVIVLDNHGSGNPENVPADCLPAGARLEKWHVFDLPAQGIDAMFQLGYHSRGGGEGFVSHTYMPGLRLRAGDELISESHGRAWAGRAPLIGIVGNDSHEQTLGSLAGTPYLVIQRTVRNDLAEPVFGEEEGLEAIREFAARALRGLGEVPPPVPPADFVFAASMPYGDDQVMEAAGWERAGEVEFHAHLAEWADARLLLDVAMQAAIAPLLPYFDGATSPEAAAALDPARVERLGQIIDRWCGEPHPEWYTAPVDELGLSIATR